MIPYDWPVDLWRHRQQYPLRPWNQLSYLWEVYPPGKAIPDDVRAKEDAIRKLVGIPPRVVGPCDGRQIAGAIVGETLTRNGR